MNDPPQREFEQRNQTSWWHALLVTPWVIGFFVILSGSITDRTIAKRQRTASGRIVQHDPANHNRYGYVFSVNGTLYTGWEIPRRDFHIGEAVLVYYDPLDPLRSALTDFAALADDQTGAILFLLTGIAFVPICIFIRKREILGIVPRPDSPPNSNAF